MQVRLTSKGRVCTSLQVHLGVPPPAHAASVVAHVVASILPAAQTDSFIEALGPCALIRKTHVFLIHQRVHKQVHCPLMLTLHHLHKV